MTASSPTWLLVGDCSPWQPIADCLARGYSRSGSGSGSGFGFGFGFGRSLQSIQSYSCAVFDSLRRSNNPGSSAAAATYYRNFDDLRRFLACLGRGAAITFVVISTLGFSFEILYAEGLAAPAALR